MAGPADTDRDVTFIHNPVSGLTFGLWRKLLSAADTADLFARVDAELQWTGSAPDQPCRRRRADYGVPGMAYQPGFAGAELRHCHNWSTLAWRPELMARIQTAICALPTMTQTVGPVPSPAQVDFNYFVAQRYPSPGIGIQRHRDREMVPGTVIAGLSLGNERTLVLEALDRSQRPDRLEFVLPAGSLYVLYPPTNDRWTHAIPARTLTAPRLSPSINPFTLAARKAAATGPPSPAGASQTSNTHAVRISLTFRRLPLPAGTSTAPRP